MLTSPEMSASTAGWRATPLVVYDGRLTPEAASHFSDRDGALLVARRQPDGVAQWELELVRRFLSGAPLLPPHAQIQQLRLCSVEDLARTAEVVRQAVAAAARSQACQDVATDVVYELSANALLDAPVDAQGTPRYAHRRHESPEIAAEDACELAFALEEGLLFVWVRDRFGRLTPGPIARTVAGLGQRARVDASGGGAGLGFRRLIDHGDVLAARVAPGRSTEVLCVVSMNDIRRRSAGLKSVYFLTERG